MAKHKYIESPEKMWELPYLKDEYGNYSIIGKPRKYSGITINNKNKNPDGYIYFIKIDNQDIYKIGVSKNVKRRLQDIDSYLPYPFQVLSIHYLKNVYDVELEISKNIERYKVRKEWYNFSIKKAKEIMIKLYNINLKQDASSN